MADHTTIDLGVDPFGIPEDARRNLRQLQRDADGCTRCALSRGRTNVVFGEGSPDADLMVVGPAPSTHDDLLGRPYVGGAGNLLTNVLLDAGLDRDDVYVTTFVKCRPTGSQVPAPDEFEACSAYLIEQLAAVRPRVVVTLGELAMRVLTRRAYPLDKVAGVRFEMHGATVIPTFDPGVALRGDHRALEGLQRDMATAARVLAGTLPSTASQAGAS